METNEKDVNAFREDRLTQQEGSGEMFSAENLSVEDHELQKQWRPHPRHGIGKYRSYSNHSSAGDQPFTSTSW